MSTPDSDKNWKIKQFMIIFGMITFVFLIFGGILFFVINRIIAYQPSRQKKTKALKKTNVQKEKAAVQRFEKIPSSDRSREKLIGPVILKIERASTFEQKHDRLQRIFTGEKKTVYSIQGNRLRVEESDAKGRIHRRIIFTYSEAAVPLLLKEVCTNGVRQIYAKSYEYDKEGRMRRSVEYDPDNQPGLRTFRGIASVAGGGRIEVDRVLQGQKSRFLHQITRRYNAAGKLTESKKADARGKIKRQLKYTYDPKQRLILVVDHEGPGKAPKRRIAYQYKEDRLFFIEEKIRTSGYGDTITKTLFDYADARRLIRRTVTRTSRQKTKARRHEYRYFPEKSYLAAEIIREDGKPGKRLEYSYDLYGNRILHRAYTDGPNGQWVPEKEQTIEYHYHDRDTKKEGPVTLNVWMPRFRRPRFFSFPAHLNHLTGDMYVQKFCPRYERFNS